MFQPMRSVTKCQTCSGRFEESRPVECPDCGRKFHEECLQYHAEYKCHKATDPAVGAVDF